MTATNAPIADPTPPDTRPRHDPAAIPALSIGGVSHSYGARRALIDVSFTVAPASFTALLGLNGAGKSTLFALITRLYPVRIGRIRIFGHDVTRESGAALQQLGVVFQTRTLDLEPLVLHRSMVRASPDERHLESGFSQRRSNERSDRTRTDDGKLHESGFNAWGSFLFVCIGRRTSRRIVTNSARICRP